MYRGKKIIFISHCILNQNSVVCPLARASGAYTGIIRILMDKGIGIHQMPCPEFRYLGLSRKPMTKEEYDTIEFRNLCKSIAKDTLNIMKEYIKSDYKIVALIGINQSPTCSINNVRGIYMEELFKIMDENNISIHNIDVPEYYKDDKDNKEFLQKIKDL